MTKHDPRHDILVEEFDRRYDVLVTKYDPHHDILVAKCDRRYDAFVV